MKRNALIAGLVLALAGVSIRLAEARHELRKERARYEARFAGPDYMAIQSAYYEGVADGQKGADDAE